MTPSQPQTLDELSALIRAGHVFAPGTVLEGRDGVGAMEAVLARWAAPDFVTVMRSEADAAEYEGIDGFRDALTDWISPYERFQMILDEVIVGEDKLVFLVRQVARTKHQGVEIETQSASVWWARDGRLTKADFYLDQRTALRAAGIDPDRPSGE
jgi:ketosteroid isomerase-like protein